MMNKWEILNTRYVNNGLMVFPVMKNGKTPLIKAWQKDCSSNFMQLLYWVEHGDNCNWGLPASENNLFVIDCDVHDENKNGVENFEKLLKDIGVDSVNTLVQRTPSGGLHIIYNTDDDLRNVSNNSNCFKNYPGIDIRTDGYIVVEPSTINGNEYKFTNNIEPNKMPDKLKEFIINNTDLKTEKKSTPYEKPKEVLVGDRDNQLFQYINQLYFKNKLDYDEIVVLANYFNENVLEKPFSKRDVAYKVKKAFEKDRSQYIIINISNE